MTDNTTFWNALQRNLPKRKWIPLTEILATVQTRVFLDDEDLDAVGSRSGAPRWEANVRRLLRLKVHAGAIRSRKKQ